eukprot:1522795-Rhodomonas_salina.1
MLAIGDGLEVSAEVGPGCGFDCLPLSCRPAPQRVQQCWRPRCSQHLPHLLRLLLLLRLVRGVLAAQREGGPEQRMAEEPSDRLERVLDARFPHTHCVRQSFAGFHQLALQQVVVDFRESLAVCFEICHATAITQPLKGFG